MKLETCFFRITLRNIWRFKIYSSINAAGLSIGMACCIFIFLWVRDELSYDAFHENAGSIYRVAVDYSPGGQPVRYAVVPGPLAPSLALDMPEVALTVRFWRDFSRESLTIGHDAVSHNERRFFFTDESVFRVFSIQLVRGNPETALAEPFSLVITEDMARKYFGDANPLGRSLTEAEEESPLIAMLLDDYYQRTLQAAPQSPSGEPAEEEPATLTVEPAPVGRPLPEGQKKRPRRRSGRDRGRERTGHPA